MISLASLIQHPATADTYARARARAYSNFSLNRPRHGESSFLGVCVIAVLSRYAYTRTVDYDVDHTRAFSLLEADLSDAPHAFSRVSDVYRSRR